MRIPLIFGIAADNQAEFRRSLPVNLEVVATDSRIAAAQFRAPSGAINLATAAGVDRGGYLYQGELYRVNGTSLNKIGADGSVTPLGTIPGEGQCGFDEGFGRLIIRGGGTLSYLTGTALTQVTDPDLGTCLDAIWIDGYTMTTDGEFVIVTELNDPTAVNPLKYGSAEEDPDEITGLIKVGNEAHALGRHSIQVFRNIGGNGFPFAPVRGATISIGCVGPDAKCLYADTFAFVGSARDEAIGVYLAGQGGATRISDRLIDDELAAVADPASIILENRSWRGERRLLVHLPAKTLCFHANATKALQEPVWTVLHSGRGQPYRLRNAVLAGGGIVVGDLNSGSVGLLSDEVSTHFGEAVEWQFDAGLLYNEARGGILHALELVGLPGRGPFGLDAKAYLSLTRDGQVFSEEREFSMGQAGQRATRMAIRPRAMFRNYLGLRFRGFDANMPGIAALEAKITPLAS